MSSLHLYSYAKINLTLDVIRKREDSYHEVEMIMQSIHLYDTIHLSTTKERGIFFHCSHPDLKERETNLAYRAAELLFQRASLPGGLVIHLKKKIPIAAGLGGGSSNAAAVLEGMTQLYSLTLTKDELSSMAASLGSDVPFFLEGGTMLCKGRGTDLYPLTPLPPMPLLLVVLPVGLKTPRVYSELRKEEKGRRLWTRGVYEAIEKGDFSFMDRLGNDLEAPARRMSPYLTKMMDRLQEEGLRPYLSGSGPTLFLFPKKEEERLKERLSSLVGSGNHIICTSTSTKGIALNHGRMVGE